MKKLLALLPLLISPAFACSCMMIGPACKEFGRDYTKAVFVGRAGAQKWVEPQAETRFGPKTWGYNLITFTVKEAFTPGLPETVQVQTGFGGGDCGYFFEDGKDYVVWASVDDNGKLYTSICSRTREAVWALTDLDYLRSFPKLKDTAWLYGEAKEYTYDPHFKRTFEPSIMDHYRPDESTYRALKPLSGTMVTATDTNGKVYSSTVDEYGDFKIDNLAPGTYTVRLEAPPQMYIFQRNPISFSLSAKSCEKIDYRTAINGQISGLLSDQNGNPLKSTYLELQDIRYPDNQERRFEERTDENGKFHFVGIPPGDFRLVVTPLGKAKSEFVRTLYPGVAADRKAKVIHLEAAQKVENLNFAVVGKIN